MKPIKIIVCDNCGNTFRPGNRKDGSLNGVGFQDKEGLIINLCHDCVAKMADDKEHQEKILELFKNKGWRK